MNHQSVQDWLTILENRHQQEIQLGLERVSQVAARLNLLRPGVPVIQIAGTNGKGSTLAALESIYFHAGYQVAAYTSPHLIVFNERIRINQQMISDEALLKAFNAIEEGRQEIHLTYFEVATLAALWHFKNEEVDVILLETGLGGRLDACNIIDNDLAIITTIDYDHEAFLGNTLESIAYEKAGIMRAGKPVIYADTTPPVTILQQVNQLGAIPYFLQKHYSIEWRQNKVYFHNEKMTVEINTGLHSHASAAAVMASIIMQNNLPINQEQLIQGLQKASIPGRMQEIQVAGKTCIMDVSHNPQSVRYLAESIAKKSRKKIHAVFSVLADKDLTRMLEPLLPLVDYWYPAILPNKRAATKEQLLIALNDYGVNEKICHNTPFAAFKRACQVADNDDMIVVFGSFLMVGAVLASVSSGNCDFK